MLYKLLSLHW